MMNNPVIAAIITAAGKSTRMNSAQKEPAVKKEYRILNGDLSDNRKALTVLGAAARAFSSIKRISKIIITYPEESINGENNAKEALPEQLLKIKDFSFVKGGASRQASVYNALCAVKSADYALIHDGARPWISTFLIDSVIDAMLEHSAAIPLLEAAETPKTCENGFVTSHLSRKTVFFAQTPQGFEFLPLIKAHKLAFEASKNGREFTDDGEIWNFAYPERKIAAVRGETTNKKITFIEDLA